MKKLNSCRSFIAADGREIILYTLEGEDFELVKSFYSREIEKLENKADFYPYKDSEIYSILNGGGIFLGGFHAGELVGLCAIDFDCSYQLSVKKANENFAAFPLFDDLLEFSGLFVASGYRKIQIAEKMSEILLEEGRRKKPNSRFFSVVLEDNVASLKNFFAMGFSLCGFWQMDETFKFVYLISPKTEDFEGVATEKIYKRNRDAANKISVDFSEVKEYLAKGYEFFGVENGKVIGVILPAQWIIFASIALCFGNVPRYERVHFFDFSLNKIFAIAQNIFKGERL